MKINWKDLWKEIVITVLIIVIITLVVKLAYVTTSLEVLQEYYNLIYEAYKNCVTI